MFLIYKFCFPDLSELKTINSLLGENEGEVLICLLLVICIKLSLLRSCTKILVLPFFVSEKIIFFPSEKIQSKTHSEKFPSTFSFR